MKAPSLGSTRIRLFPPVDGQFRQPTDVTWDTNGNIFISDGYINSRVAKIRQERRLGEAVGNKGSKPGESARCIASQPIKMETSTWPIAAIDGFRYSIRKGIFCG